MNFQKTAFLDNLKFWSIHCTVTAFPSFLVAGIYLELFKSAAGALAMVVGVLIFILGYALLSSSLPLLRAQDSIFSRALSIALKIRIGISAMGIIGVLVPIVFMFHPDYWAGLAAKQILETAHNFIWPTPGYYDLADKDEFLPILLWTLTEGLLLSGFLFLLTLLCLLGVEARKAIYTNR